MQTQNISTAKNVKDVGLIIIDEIVNLYLIEIGSETKNSKLNDQLTHILALLSKIVKDYGISVLLLNSFANKQEKSEKSDKTDKFLAVPHGGKVIDYWVNTEIQLKRTPQPSRMIFNLKKDSNVWHIIMLLNIINFGTPFEIGWIKQLKNIYKLKI